MRTVFSLTMLLVVILLITACAAQGTELAPTPLPAPSNSYTPTDPSIPLDVTVGGTFQVIVDANPSTGYHWEMIGPLDDRYLTFVSREYVAEEPVMPGSGGVEIWTFEAAASGEAVIVLGYYPPDQGEPAYEEVTFNVVVK